MRKAIPEIGMLSLDDRVRESAARLGVPLLPADADLSAWPPPEVRVIGGTPDGLVRFEVAIRSREFLSLD